MAAETISQAYTFIIFLINGMLIGILFDFFRILRKSFKTKDWITCLEDMIFWILTGILLLYSIFIFNHGELRFYLFIAIGIGNLMYMLLFSKLIIHLSVKLIQIVKSIIKKILFIIIYPIKLFYQLIKKVFLKPISFIFINLRNFTSKNFRLCSKKIKNILIFKKKEGKQA